MGEYLNEEKLQKNKKKLKGIALLIFIVGIIIGGSFIAKGFLNNSEIKSKYSSDNKTKLNEKLNNEKINLEKKKQELINSGIIFSEFSKYTDGEAYDLKVITKALDPSFEYCKFDEYKNNSNTSRYCSLKIQIENLNNNFNKSFDTSKNIPLFIFGAFIIIIASSIAFYIYIFTKRPQIAAFTTQQIMPVAKESIETLTPTIGKVARDEMEKMAPDVGKILKKELEDIAPSIGKVAKEIKDNLNNDKK